MTIDERLQALTMNLELQFRETEQLRQDMRADIKELRDTMKELRDTMKELRDNIHEVVEIVHTVVDTVGKASDSIDRLTRIVESHEHRLQRLES
jgi:methyl-accepting chemotaxis protein